jgi:hypothetical protein
MLQREKSGNPAENPYFKIILEAGPTRWVCEKSRPKCIETHFLKIYTQLLFGKK